MTTLPQTTTVRLPRPAGNGQLATAGTALAIPNAGVSANGGSTMTAGDAWRVIRAHAWLILIFLLVAGFAAYFINAYLMKHYPKYTAVGYLEVQPLQNPDPTILMTSGADVNVVGMEQKTQVAALQTEGLLSRVLSNESSEVRRTKWYQKYTRTGSDNSLVKEDFFDSFHATALPETRIVKVEFTGTDPKDCQTIVREICEQHIIDERKAVLDNGQKQSQQLEQMRLDYLSKETDLGQKMDNLRSQISGAGGEVGGGISIRQFQLQRLSETLSKTEADLQAASAQMTTAKESLAKGIDPLMVENMVNANGQVAQHRLTLESLEAQYQQSLDVRGDNHPQTIQMKKALDREQEKASAIESESRSKARTSYLEELNGMVTNATTSRDKAKAAVEDAQKDLEGMSTKLARYYTYQKQLQNVVEDREHIAKQLLLLVNGQQQKLDYKISWYGRPELPSTPSFPKLKVIMPIALALGLMMALGIAFLREMTDTTVRTDRDIVRVGQMQLLGMVGDEAQDPQATGARLPLVIFDAPHSMTAEQLRQVRTRLQHAASLDTTRSLLVTSPSPGDGKTTIACNLAAGLALNGRRILLVDGNFRRPEIHKVFAVGNEAGFSGVLGGSTTFDEAIHETQVPNLAVMAAGPKPINATEMFESQLLVDFIDRALEEFDHVIFDSGPMMVVSESAAMAPRVDGVVTVVKARGNSRGLLGRMRDTLRALKAEHLGVVLNGVRAQGGGYYGRNIKAFYEYQNG